MSRRLAMSAVVVGLWPVPAHAHLVTTGLGPLYDGVSHLLFSPDDLLAVLAMAALAGLNGATAGRRGLFVLSLAWLIGATAGLRVDAGEVPPAAAAAVTLLVLGLLTAVDCRLSPLRVAGVAVALGLVHGWLNGVGIDDAGGGSLRLVGTVSAVFVIAALAAGLVVSLRAAWARVAVRAVGSWVAAIGLLMLGWSLRS
jgi:hydrogenase/urease accessory protein HupE